MRRFILPVGVSFVFVAWSPFIGEVRNVVRDRFPDQFVAIMTLMVGFGLVVAAGSAVARIRTDAVERFHFLEYGLVGFLFYRALLDHAPVATTGFIPHPARRVTSCSIFTPSSAALSSGSVFGRRSW